MVRDGPLPLLLDDPRPFSRRSFRLARRPHRGSRLLVAVAVVVMAFVFKALPVCAQDGRPAGSMTGVWYFGTHVPLERLAGDSWPLLSAAEARLRVDAVRDLERRLTSAPVLPAPPAADVDVHPDGSPAEVSPLFMDFPVDPGDRRSSLIDSLGGRVPLPGPRRILADVRRAWFTFGLRASDLRPDDWLDALSPVDRCLLGFNAGPPFWAASRNSYVLILDTPSVFAVKVETQSTHRLVPFDRDVPPPGVGPAWSGWSTARRRLDGAVDVVTRRFRSPSFPPFRIDPAESILETFRLEADVLLYRAVLTRAASGRLSDWSYVLRLRRTPDPLFEYACHEGARAGLEIRLGAPRGPTLREAVRAFVPKLAFYTVVLLGPWLLIRLLGGSRS